ncbi:hypothetical protein D9M72_20930 [compost metagenome]
MSVFLRLLNERGKAAALLEVCRQQRAAGADERIFDVLPQAFDAVPGKPFAYWVSEAVRETFKRLPAFESEGRRACFGLSTKDDTSFLRLHWEVSQGTIGEIWIPFVKGGAFSPFYADPYLLIDWGSDGKRLKAFADHRTRQIFGTASWSRWINNWGEYLRPGLTWPRRTSSGLSLRAMPKGCIFADKGPAAFVADDAPEALLALCGLANSQAFGLLVSLQLAAADAAARSYEVGVIQKTPVADLGNEQQATLSSLARRGWSLKRTLDTVTEASHAFLLPAALRPRLGDYNVPAIEAELACIQAEIDAIAFDLYGFSDADRAAALGSGDSQLAIDDPSDDDEGDEDDAVDDAPSSDGLLSWAVGVAFGRFDWRLATGDRTAPSEPEPFDPLPAKSPGMLPDGGTPFYQHAGILVDDLGHPCDLARLIEQVLETVDAPVTEDVRRWLQKDFFAFHLKRYSKSRRKAPIYWPLTTASGSYTLWLYYPSLGDQTLFTAVNDFVDPKLEDVRKELQALRDKGASRSKEDEKRLEALASLEHELADLRDSLLEIAPNYRPHHDDGVQISAAPLWKLFRHKPWQKVLKDTWAKLEKGDYDWAHLAMNYWPERVREKCVTDKSLAIAHGLEHLYVEPEPTPKKTRGRKKAGSAE